MTLLCRCSSKYNKTRPCWVYKSSGNLGLKVPAKKPKKPETSSFSFYTLILFHPPLSPDLKLFTAFQMLKPPNYSVVLSLDKSIRDHIGFLLKATDCAACIDSSVGQFRPRPREAHPYTHTGTHIVLSCSQRFIFWDSPGGEKDIKTKNKDQSRDNTV